VRALEDSADKNLLAKSSSGAAIVQPGRAEAGIFLYPGKEFRVVSQLLTNFHLPQSSLLALVAAFAGRESVLRARMPTPSRPAIDSTVTATAC
jgi:S-adenosylmethionine:tRNA-ribosyltransferase-isomerase (queuine synthetase)